MDRNEVLRYLGYKNQALDPALDSRLDAVIDHCIQVGRPVGSVRVFPVAGTGVTEDGRPQVLLEGTALRLVGKSMQHHMRDAVAVGVLAVTIGMGVERELRRYNVTHNAVDGMIFDAAATTLVERAADAAEASLVHEAADRGLYTNFRFSPGYGDMPMETQPVLLSALDATRRLGITLSATNYMTPTKSVTAVLGMFTEPQPTSHATCADCLCRDFCTIRATGRTCRGQRISRGQDTRTGQDVSRG